MTLPSSRRADPGPDLAGLGSTLRARFAAALSAGDLEPIETGLHEIEDAGVRFAVRAMRGRDRKRGGRPRASAGNPFLPYEASMYVADLGPRHVCLLNKFPVLRDHVLLVTRAFEDQDTPLGRADFEALWGVLAELGGVGFYNAGAIAGASQRHRHLQVVPTPLGRGPQPTPIEDLLEAARFDGPLGQTPALPFLHAFARLRSCQGRAPAEAARALFGLYREMARAFGCDRAGRPYNLLVTRDWMLFVPRAREGSEGISLNAVAFAGAILVRDAAQLARVREVGPMALLRQAGVAGGTR